MSSYFETKKQRGLATSRSWKTTRERLEHKQSVRTEARSIVIAAKKAGWTEPTSKKKK